MWGLLGNYENLGQAIKTPREWPNNYSQVLILKIILWMNMKAKLAVLKGEPENFRVGSISRGIFHNFWVNIALAFSTVSYDPFLQLRCFKSLLIFESLSEHNWWIEKVGNPIGNVKQRKNVTLILALQVQFQFPRGPSGNPISNFPWEKSSIFCPFQKFGMDELVTGNQKR